MLGGKRERGGETVEDEDGGGVERKDGLGEERHGLDEVGDLDGRWKGKKRSGSSGSSPFPREDGAGCRKRRTMPGRSHEGGPSNTERGEQSWKVTLAARQ